MIERNLTRYQNGKIYKIVSNHTDDVYYGSTCLPLSKRFHTHKRNYKKWLNGKYSYTTSYEIVKYEDALIFLVEAYPCNTKMELERQERFYIEHYQCINKKIPGRTGEQYREDNRERLRQKNREYTEMNREQIRMKAKKYREENKDKIKAHYEANKDEIRKARKEYCKKNREALNKKKNERLFCECGTEYTRSHRAEHQKSQRHQQQIEELLKLFECL